MQALNYFSQCTVFSIGLWWLTLKGVVCIRHPLSIWHIRAFGCKKEESPILNHPLLTRVMSQYKRLICITWTAHKFQWAQCNALIVPCKGDKDLMATFSSHSNWLQWGGVLGVWSAHRRRTCHTARALSAPDDPFNSNSITILTSNKWIVFTGFFLSFLIEK